MLEWCPVVSIWVHTRRLIALRRKIERLTHERDVLAVILADHHTDIGDND